MPGLVRKLLIFATVDGLVLQAHGPTDHHKAISIDFKTRRSADWVKGSPGSSEKSPRLESHGIIGQITIASLSFLIAITKREQVAQVFGKPIYVVTDVAILPLTSRDEANKAIDAAVAAQGGEATHSDDSEFSDSEDETPSTNTGNIPPSPSEDDRPMQHSNSSGVSIAENVATRTGSYGKFASQWFSKQRWMSPKSIQAAPKDTIPKSSEKENSSQTLKPSSTDKTHAASEAAEVNKESKEEVAASQDLPAPTNTATINLLPRILRSTKMILSSRSYFFSYEIDLTHRLALMGGRPQPPSFSSLDPMYFWNRRMGASLFQAGHESFFVPIIQGFVGQRTFALKETENSGLAAITTEETEAKGNAHKTNPKDGKDFLLTLISRRSTKRSGLRYLRRGIDDDGNCANFVETEQILSTPTWDISEKIRSFVQIRGSIPLYFSQSPYSFKPVVVLHNSSEANQRAFVKHFQGLKKQYGAVYAACLVDKHGSEVAAGSAYEKLYTENIGDEQLNDLKFEWFDFHMECRGMKFENVQRLVVKLKDDLDRYGETVLVNGVVEKTQSGIIRTNCMDCLDRTNVAESAFGQYILQKDLEEDGFQIDLVKDESTNWFNTLWADNGDAISRQYASTAALKGDFTRTRKRNWRGAVNDFGLTLSRYYSNMVNDYFSQAVIDLLLQNVSWKVFEDFESTMMSADPGISVKSAREAAVEKCARIVIQEPDEDLIHGWTLLAPAQEGTLRTLPFEEVVLLLTDAAVYCCKLDLGTEKVASFEKVDLKSISKIRFGTYITSTFTESQLDEDLNQGLVVVFTPGKDDLIRVNTRSLQNQTSLEVEGSSSIDGGTGLLSWLATRSSSNQPKTMALKVIASNMDEGESSQTPRQIAEHISGEIIRAIVGPIGTENQKHTEILEAGEIISVAEAKRRTGYLEQIGHSIKKLVWA